MRIEPGETLCVESEDALSGQIRKPGDVRDKSKMPYSNPVAGPIFVNGARSGDTLAVRLREIRPTLGQCATYTGRPSSFASGWGPTFRPGPTFARFATELFTGVKSSKSPTHRCSAASGPRTEWSVPSTLPAGVHGGNMDLVETCPGNTVFLPVFVEGAYLYLGDAHAAMGHGELSATGLEMPAETTLTVDLVKGKRVPAPRIESPDEIMTVASGCPMERSIAQAMAWLILWMEEKYGWNRWRAYDILTHVAEISVGYYGIGTVGVKIAKSYASLPS